MTGLGYVSDYKRLAEVAGWLAEGKAVQYRCPPVHGKVWTPVIPGAYIAPAFEYRLAPQPRRVFGVKFPDGRYSRGVWTTAEDALDSMSSFQGEFEVISYLEEIPSEAPCASRS